MKFNVIFFVFFGLVVLTTQLGFTQSAYYDALELTSYTDPTTHQFQLVHKGRVDSILAKYVDKKQNDLDISTIRQIYDPSNPFITPLFPTSWPKTLTTGLSSLLKGTSLSSIGGLDVTTYADGFAKFLVARTKEELSVAFFNRFKDLLNEDKYKDARILFPQTYELLNAIGDQIYNYSAYLNALREAFEKDLNGLLTTLPKVIKSGRYSEFFTAHPELKASVLSSAYFADGLFKKEHPGKIIAEYDMTLLDSVNINVKGIVQTLQLFSESVRSQSADHYWVSSDSLKLLTEDPVARRIYLGLIYQKADNIRFNGKVTSLKQVLDTVATALDKEVIVMSYIENVVRETDDVTNAVKKLEGKNLSKLTFTDYYSYYNSAIALLDIASRVYTFPGLDDLNKPDMFSKYITVAHIGSNIALDITRRNYSSAIMNSYQLYIAAFQAEKNDAELKKIVDTVSIMKNFLFRYGYFIASVAQAQSSDEVQRAIEAAALPAGSSSIKRHSCFDVSMNAYVGLYFGTELIDGLDDSFGAFHINAYGVTAPIGITFGTSTEGWSLSFFVSAFDLGAITAFRFKDDSTNHIPTVQLKDIVSPGIFLSVGMAGCPLSINIGAQMGSNLRTVTATANNYSKAMYYRYSVSLCVDIPLMEIYNKPKN